MFFCCFDGQGSKWFISSHDAEGTVLFVHSIDRAEKYRQGEQITTKLPLRLGSEVGADRHTEQRELKIFSATGTQR